MYTVNNTLWTVNQARLIVCENFLLYSTKYILYALLLLVLFIDWIIKLMKIEYFFGLKPDNLKKKLQNKHCSYSTKQISWFQLISLQLAAKREIPLPWNFKCRICVHLEFGYFSHPLHCTSIRPYSLVYFTLLYCTKLHCTPWNCTITMLHCSNLEGTRYFSHPSFKYTGKVSLTSGP